MMGSEGFSWCDTEHLFFRDQHWQDWDTCALCSQADTSSRNYSLYPLHMLLNFDQEGIYYK